MPGVRKLLPSSVGLNIVPVLTAALRPSRCGCFSGCGSEGVNLCTLSAHTGDPTLPPMSCSSRSWPLEEQGAQVSICAIWLHRKAWRTPGFVGRSPARRGIGTQAHVYCWGNPNYGKIILRCKQRFPLKGKWFFPGRFVAGLTFVRGIRSMSMSRTGELY